MSMVTLAGPLGSVDTAIHKFVLNREFHPENASALIPAEIGLTPVAGDDPYAENLARARRLAGILGVPLHFQDFAAHGLCAGRAADAIEALDTEVSALVAEREELSRYADECDALATQVEYFLSVDERLANLLNMRYVKFRYGKIHTADYAYCFDEIRKRRDAFVIDTSQIGDWTYMMYVALPRTITEVDALTAARGFTRIRIPDSFRGEGTATEASLHLADESAKARARIGEIGETLAALGQQKQDELLENYSCLRFYSEAYGLRASAGRRRDWYFLIGWVPTEGEDTYVDECDRAQDITCFSAQDEEVDFTAPPTKLRLNFLQKIFEPLLSMYGQPSYRELDPSMFVAVTYMILYGIMFGDVGQGIVMALVGLFVRFKMKNWLGGIITCCGVSATLVGFVYGSVFGNEEIMPWGFKALRSGNVTTMLVFAIGLGAVLIALVMGLNIYNGFRRKDWGKALFSGNGIAGFVFYYGLIAAGLCTLVLHVNLFHVWYTIPVLILPLVCIMLSEPLGHMLKRGPGKKKVKVGSYVSTGFFEMFETVLAYLTNTMSFLRVGAYAIIHVGLMMVVQILAGTHVQGLAVIIIGNAFVIGFEGFLVGIQALRLEFYELFSRFYAGDGKKFTAPTVDYSR